MGVAGGGEAKNQFEVVGVLTADFLMNGEIMPTVSSLSRMDVFLPGTAEIRVKVGNLVRGGETVLAVLH